MYITLKIKLQKTMRVIKRDGQPQDVDFNRVARRNMNLARPDTITELNASHDPKVNIVTRQLTPLTAVDPNMISKEVIRDIHDGVTTVELDVHSAKIAQSLCTYHPQYGELAGRIYISNYHKNNIYDLAKNEFKTSVPTDEQRQVVENSLFLKTAQALWNNTDKLGQQAPLIAPHVYRIIEKNAERFEELLDYTRDFNFDFLGMTMMEQKYLLAANLFNGKKMHRVPIERPQHMFMRVAIGLHCSGAFVPYSNNTENDFSLFEKAVREVVDLTADELYKIFTALLPFLKFPAHDTRVDWSKYDLNQHDGEITDAQWKKIVETYNIMSRGEAVHATPTLFNAGTLRPQCSSCFLVMLPSDSLEGIARFFTMLMHIQKGAGGLGSSIHNLRSAGSYIRGTNGTSNGLVPFAKVVNAISLYIDQCFDPSTIIYTKDGVKTVADVVVGDKLVTKDGSFQKVTNVLQHNFQSSQETMAYKLSIMHSLEPVLVTGKHPLYVLHQKKGVNYDIIRNRLEKGYIKPEYKEVENLDDEYLVGIPFPTYQQDRPNLSNDDCYMYGIMLGGGSISSNLKTHAVYLNDTTKSEVVNFVQSYLDNLNIKYYESLENNCHRIVWYRNVLFPFNRAMLYDANGEKIVHKSMLHLPKSKTFSIIGGLLDTDGCIGKEIMIEMTSRNVIESIRYMLLRFKIGTSGYVRDRVGESHEIRPGEVIKTTKKSYVVRIPFVKDICGCYPNLKVGEFLKYFIYDDMLWSRIKSVNPVEHNGVMIDYEIENNHNYMTHSGLAHNGGGKRPGSHALYLGPWHADMPSFLELRRPRGNDHERARELFYGFWNNDEFMWRVEMDSDWWLMCPDQCSEILGKFNAKASETFVDDRTVLENPNDYAFSHTYRQYVREGKFVKKIKAREIWDAVLELQTEQGMPYMLHSDNVNRKNNQANLGSISHSNLCVEIQEFTSANEVAVCNLASICLPTFVEDGEGEFAYECSLTQESKRRHFNMERFKYVVKHMTKNLDSVIDTNYYPVEEAKRSNLRHRPIGLGVQGLADLFTMLRIPFDSQEAIRLNFYIFEAMYFAALDASNELAQEKGSYESFQGCPASQGLLQFDLVEREGLARTTEQVGGTTINIFFERKQNWNSLKQRIMTTGLRNSLVVAPMPTASTSYLMKNSPCFEPYNSNIYKRANDVGEFVVVNELLINDLISLGLWSNDMKNKIMLANGSIQDIVDIPKTVRILYKTAWDMSPKAIINLAISRSPFVDQSQSMNLFIERPSPKILTQIHFYTWRRGLKTGSYYIHSRPPVDAQKLQIADQQAVDLIKRSVRTEEPDSPNIFGEVCTMKEGCLSCGS